MRRPRFGLLGAAGYVAPRHLAAMHAVGGELVVAGDPCDSVGILDRYGLDVAFTQSERDFSAALRERRQGPADDAVNYVAVCSPNHLHLAHARLALTEGAHVIGEKPLALGPRELDELAQLEARSERRVYAVLQLREHAELVALRRRLLSSARQHHDVTLTYLTPRGPWYQASWKGDPGKSGGVALNIGIHLFDLLLWLFGPAAQASVHHTSPARLAGTLELERATARWLLSTDPRDAARARSGRVMPFRSLVIDGEEIDFSDGFTGLHERVYRGILTGQAPGIEDARPSVELADRLRSLAVTTPDASAHPDALPT